MPVLAWFLAALTCSLLMRAVERTAAGRPVHGWSVCACGQRVDWLGLLPVVGWLVRRGRASCCSARIPVRYPLLENLWGTQAVLLVARADSSAGVPATTVSASVLLAVATFVISWQSSRRQD